MKTLYPKTLYLMLFKKFRLVSAMIPIIAKVSDTPIKKSGEHIGVPILTWKKVKPSADSTACNHLLHCNFLPSFDSFSILAHGSKKYFLKLKDDLLITRNKPTINRNINSTSLYQFGTDSSRLLAYSKLVYLTSLVYFILNIIIKL